MIMPMRDMQGFEQALSNQDGETVINRLRELACTQNDFASIQLVNRLLDRSLSLPAVAPLKVTVLRTFTFEQIVPVLRSTLIANGIASRVRLGDFNQFEQVLHDTSTDVADCDVLILAALLEDLAPQLVL